MHFGGKGPPSPTLKTNINGRITPPPFFEKIPGPYAIIMIIVYIPTKLCRVYTYVLNLLDDERKE